MCYLFFIFSKVIHLAFKFLDPCYTISSIFHDFVWTCYHKRQIYELIRIACFVVLLFGRLMVYLGFALLHITNDDQFFFSFYVFTSSSLFMSMSHFIWIGKNCTWKGTCYFIMSYPCWWVVKKNEVVIGIRGSF